MFHTLDASTTVDVPDLHQGSKYVPLLFLLFRFPSPLSLSRALYSSFLCPCPPSPVKEPCVRSSCNMHLFLRHTTTTRYYFEVAAKTANGIGKYASVGYGETTGRATGSVAMRVGLFQINLVDRRNHYRDKLGGTPGESDWTDVWQGDLPLPSGADPSKMTVEKLLAQDPADATCGATTACAQIVGPKGWDTHLDVWIHGTTSGAYSHGRLAEGAIREQLKAIDRSATSVTIKFDDVNIPKAYNDRYTHGHPKYNFIKRYGYTGTKTYKVQYVLDDADTTAWVDADQSNIVILSSIGLFRRGYSLKKVQPCSNAVSDCQGSSLNYILKIAGLAASTRSVSRSAGARTHAKTRHHRRSPPPRTTHSHAHTYAHTTHTKCWACCMLL